MQRKEVRAKPAHRCMQWKGRELPTCIGPYLCMLHWSTKLKAKSIFCYGTIFRWLEYRMTPSKCMTCPHPPVKVVGRNGYPIWQLSVAKKSVMSDPTETSSIIRNLQIKTEGKKELHDHTSSLCLKLTKLRASCINGMHCACHLCTPHPPTFLTAAGGYYVSAPELPLPLISLEGTLLNLLWLLSTFLFQFESMA